ncbi:uncharacterized protein LOC123676105 [Harmonia axyridis]|uniref:uncharacterized protein LOC123676105 n=1 Tax=Harmonia axyridis TaxID=115357 RepID=UPI001E27908B|nr:uncharacterized protein LOC123676105 [Harmonia axyridis]
MSYWSFLFFLCCFLKLGLAQQKELPKYIDKCSLNHNFKKCVLNSAQKAIPVIVKGDPEYNIPNMQPLHVPFVGLINTNQLVLNFTDTQVYGLENAKMVDIIIDKNNKLSSTPIFAIPNATLKGEYSISGTLLALNLNGKGQYSVTLLNGVYKYPLVIEKVTKDGVDYYQARGKKLIFDFEDVKFDIGDFLEGGNGLGKQINKLLTENWKELLEDFRPVISDVVNTIILDIFNKIAQDVPAKNVFLPD